MKEISILVAALLVDICFGVTTCKLRFAQLQRCLVACMLLSVIERESIQQILIWSLYWRMCWNVVLSVNSGQNIFFVSQCVCEYLMSVVTLCMASTFKEFDNLALPK